MSVTDWIISISAGLIAILLGVIAYFGQKWIQSVDEKLKEQSQAIEDNTLKIVSLTTAQSYQAASVSQAVQAQLSTFKFPSNGKIDKIESEVTMIRETMQSRVLPHISLSQQQLGQVIVIEERQKIQEQKLIKLYEVLVQLAQRLKK